MVGFHDLVGTAIAPVSKKTAVKRQYINVNTQDYIYFTQGYFASHFLKVPIFNKNIVMLIVSARTI